MHRVLLTPEIVEDILARLPSKRDLARVARTTKSWSDLALEKIWADPPLVPLLTVLAPMLLTRVSYENDHGSGWNSTPDPYHIKYQVDFIEPSEPNWERFGTVSRRVRTICHDDRYPTGCGNGTLPTELFTWLAFHKSSELTPNLRDLTWHASSKLSLQHLMLFVPPNLRTLALSSDTMPGLWFSQCIKSLSTRPLKLLDFSLAGTYNAGPLAEPLARLVQASITLQSVRLPSGCWTSSLGASLGALPNLNFLDVAPGIPLDWDGEHTYCAMTMQPDWFHSLQSLEFAVTLSEGEAMLSVPECLPVMRSLKITSQPDTISGEETLHALLCAIASFHHQLVTLQLNLQSTFPDTDLQFETFSPLFACVSLRTLRIDCARQIHLDTDEIQRMGQAWPNMERLTICQNVAIESSGLPLELLPAFSASFPKLKKLGVTLDTSDPPMELPSSGFANLCKLNVGSSPISPEDVYDVAAFLSDLLSPSTNLSYTRTSMPTRGHVWADERESVGDDEERGNQWQRVKSLMIFLPGYKKRVISRHVGRRQEGEDSDGMVTALQVG